MQLAAVTVSRTRKKQPGWKRQDKQRRIAAARKEARAEVREAIANARRLNRRIARLDAPFRGCDPERTEALCRSRDAR